MLFKSFARNKAGNVAVIFAASSAALLMLSFSATEFARAFGAREDLQNALDGAVLAGARARSIGSADWEDAARSVFDASLRDIASIAEFEVDGPIVRGVASHEMPVFAPGLLGKEGVSMTVRAAAAVGAGAAPCILLLEPSARGVLMNADSRITSDCGLQANSSGSQAILINSGAVIETPSNRLTGEVYYNGSGAIASAPEEGVAAIADPLASLAEPIPASACIGYTANGGETLTLPPQTYCGYFNMNPGSRVVLQPGLHIFKTHLTVGSGTTLEGAGVTIHIAADGGKLQVNSGAVVSLSAPTSGPYEGILFFQSRANAEQFIFNTSAELDLGGTLYLPAAELVINSGTTVDPIAGDLALVARSMIVNTDAKFIVDRDIEMCGESDVLPSAIEGLCAASGVPRLVH